MHPFQSKKYLLPLSGLLLYAAWPMSPLTVLIFVGFIPLLIQETTVKNSARFFGILLLNMLIWNIATTWWIWNASPGGAIGAILVNSLLMCLPWMLFRYTKKKLGENMGYAALILYWLSWEYIHHHWDLSWPWLTLGNVFSTHPAWVRWYAYTGTTGGSLWVLLINIVLFKAFATQNKKNAVLATLLLALPFAASFFIDIDNTSPQAHNVVVVQPNVEPYTEKFSTDPALLIDKMIALSESQLDTNTRMVIWPETAIPVQVWEDEISFNQYYRQVFAFASKHPEIMLVTGIDSYKNWGNANKQGFSIRHLPNGNAYEAYNTAFATDSSHSIQLYHKSKLVPGVEALPAWLGFMSSIFDSFGGTSGTLGRSDSAVVFSSPGNPYKAAPVICYESIYSDYVTSYIRRGANIITVITNDGWWGNTPGYKQHMSMSRLRAIETGCWVARSANTGISCFINPRGEVLQAQGWDKASAIKMNVPVSIHQTFYVKYGDWISPVAFILGLMVLAGSIVVAMLKKKNSSLNAF